VTRARKSRDKREAELAAQTAEANAQMQKFLDLEAHGLYPLLDFDGNIVGVPAAGGPAVPWLRGNKETWIVTLIADHERHFRETGNGYFILAAFDASAYLPDRAAHKELLAWVDIGLHLLVRRLLAGGNPLAPKRGERSLLRQAQKRLRDSALALKVWNRLPIDRGDETWAIAHVAAAEELSITVVGDAWRDFKKRRQQQT
jgi:hypothetical protein